MDQYIEFLKANKSILMEHGIVGAKYRKARNKCIDAKVNPDDECAIVDCERHTLSEPLYTLSLNLHKSGVFENLKKFRKLLKIQQIQESELLVLNMKI